MLGADFSLTKRRVYLPQRFQRGHIAQPNEGSRVKVHAADPAESLRRQRHVVTEVGEGLRLRRTPRADRITHFQVKRVAPRQSPKT